MYVYNSPMYRSWCQQELRKHLLRRSQSKRKEQTQMSTEQPRLGSGQPRPWGQGLSLVHDSALSSYQLGTQRATRLCSPSWPSKSLPPGNFDVGPREVIVFLLICLISIWLLDQLVNLQGQKEHFSAFSNAKFYYHTERILGKDSCLPKSEAC